MNQQKHGTSTTEFIVVYLRLKYRSTVHIFELLSDWAFFVVGAPPTILGLFLLSDEAKGYRAARICFWLAAVWAWGKFMWWGMHSPDKFFSRALAVFIACGIVGVGLVEGLRLASRREAHHEQAQVGNNSAGSAAQANIKKESQPIQSTIAALPNKESKHHSSISAAMIPTPLSSPVSSSAPVFPSPSGPTKTPSAAHVKSKILTGAWFFRGFTIKPWHRTEYPREANTSSSVWRL